MKHLQRQQEVVSLSSVRCAGMYPGPATAQQAQQRTPPWLLFRRASSSESALPPWCVQYQASNFSVRWEQLGYDPGTEATVRDLWAGEDLGVFSRSFSAEVRHRRMGALEACLRARACACAASSRAVCVSGAGS